MSSSTSDSESSSSRPTTQLKRKRDKVPSPAADISDSSDSESSASEEPESDSDSEHESEEEIQALSHAEKRRLKKLAKLAAKVGEDAPPAKKRKVASATAPLPKRQNSVWVGNLSFKTTPEALKAFFNGCGDITRVHMPTKAVAGPGMKAENRGFAYVDFDTPDGKIAAIARSEQPLVGRKLLIKDGDDFTGRPAGAEGDSAEATKILAGHSKTAQKILRSQKNPPAPTLFLGNLGFEATEKSIREVFDAHRVKKPKVEVKGEEGKEETEGKKEQKDEQWIRKIRMGTFEDSGLCKGFAFVDFTTIEHATSALVNPKNHSLDGRKLVVEYASADAVRRGGGPKPAKAKREEGAKRVGPRGLKKASRYQKEQAELAPLRESTSEASKMEVDGAAQWPSRPANKDLGEAGSKPPRAIGRNGKPHKGPASRPKPGAALALAKRESAAIVPGKGQKIIF